MDFVRAAASARSAENCGAEESGQNTNAGAAEDTTRLAESWDAAAEEWIAWARRPGHDSYDVFHRAAFLPLIPAPAGLTADLGCGEGRVTRDLAAKGHRVIGFDRSLTMCRAVRTHPTQPMPAVVTDAARLPLPGNSVDCVVAFMALHDIDAMHETVAEIARILRPGGRLVFAVVHPVNSVGGFTGQGPDRPFVINESWFERHRRLDEVARDGLHMTFHSVHRPLQDYTEALADAGFLIERLREVTNPDPANSWHRMPMFLHVRAVRLADTHR